MVVAVLIAGGNPYDESRYTAELYLPSFDVSCKLPSLPDERSSSTVDSTGLLCGGQETRSYCIELNSNTSSWEETVTLNANRWMHVSWTPDPEIGTYLMGGFYEDMTTTLIKPDGTQEPGFPLKHDARFVFNIDILFDL